MRLVSVFMAIALLASCNARGADDGAPDVSQSSERAAPAAPADDRPRVLIVGTSLTAGFGLDIGDAYPAVLQRMADSAGFGVHVVNAGSSGETSAGALRRIDWLLSAPAAVVVIETGANDGLRGLDVDSTAANLRSIVVRAKALSPSARIVIAQMEAPPNMGADYTQRFHALFGDVARETGAVLMPFLLEHVAGMPALNQSDGIHPTAEGARRTAANVWRTLAPLMRNAGRGRT